MHFSLFNVQFQPSTFPIGTGISRFRGADAIGWLTGGWHPRSPQPPWRRTPPLRRPKTNGGRKIVIEKRPRANIHYAFWTPLTLDANLFQALQRCQFCRIFLRFYFLKDFPQTRSRFNSIFRVQFLNFFRVLVRSAKNFKARVRSRTWIWPWVWQIFLIEGWK